MRASGSGSASLHTTQPTAKYFNEPIELPVSLVRGGRLLRKQQQHKESAREQQEMRDRKGLETAVPSAALINKSLFIAHLYVYDE